MRSRRRRRIVGRLPDWRRGLEPAAPLRSMEWSRSERAIKAVSRPRAAIFLVLAAVELAALVWLAAGPVFAIHDVSVSGLQRLSAAQVRAAAGLSHPGSLLTLDAGTIRHDLATLVWVRDAQVTPVLPGRVEIAVEEWQPVAGYRPGAQGPVLLLNSEAVVLSSVPAAPGLLEVDGPPGRAPAIAQRALDQQLLTVMVNIAKAFPGVTGQEARSLKVDSCGDLTLTAKPGFRVIFGRVLTPEQFNSLDAKLSALASIKGQVDYSSPDLDYVNVENPSAPAVHLHSTPAPSPAPSASPAPGGSPAPGASPMPGGGITPVNPCR